MEVILPAKTMIYEVIVSLVSFLVLFGVLARFAFPPITKMLDKRSDTIRESLEASEATRIEAERLLEEYKTQMTEARHEAAKVIEQGRKIAETMKSEIMAKANEDAQALLVKAREGIEAEKKAAIAELQGSVADLSVAVAGKLIGETLKPEDHAKLIERYVAEVGALNEN
jgi:F-type H+-transporting ATPase subunit b